MKGFEINPSIRNAILYYTVKEGMIVDSVVRAINSWGVFVSYNNLDMLIHVSDLDFGRVKQPSDLVSIGQTLRCKIIKIDPETNRISASVKDLNSDPYEDIEKKYKAGSIYPAEIVKLQEPKLLFGQVEHRFEIQAECIRSRDGLFNAE